MDQKIKIGITAGDINGVGLDIILRIFAEDGFGNQFIPVLYATPQSIKFYKNLLELSEKPIYKIIKNTTECEEGKLNLRICTEEEIVITPGEPSESGGKFALAALQLAMADVKDGQIQAICTAPIDKHSIKSDNFPFNGHTGYLANEMDATNYAMMLVSDNLRVGLVTEHVPLKDVSSLLTQNLILEKIRVIHESLRIDFGIIKPKIAVLGLNPHSGDGGVIGREEIEIINPAIEKAQAEKMVVWGPYSADGFFGNHQFSQFDAVLAMYHDQGLIPFKYMAFEDGVNFTAGLPIVRTSPDHGTAYTLVGKGIANVSSFTAALNMANRIHNQRIENLGLTKNPLDFTKYRKEKFSIGIPNIPKREG
ncbi:MAG: 4-hydroxythreonine-4-phosphate dehydrogenase PdxA [Bacteroidia bacterium]